jgi:hypothetical protein
VARAGRSALAAQSAIGGERLHQSPLAPRRHSSKEPTAMRRSAAEKGSRRRRPGVAGSGGTAVAIYPLPPYR